MGTGGGSHHAGVTARWRSADGDPRDGNDDDDDRVDKCRDTDSSKVDEDGSFRVPNYRGVWVNPAGRNFVKIDGRPVLENDAVKLFDSPEDAARHRDDLVLLRDVTDAEMNYRPDGTTRIVYEDKGSNSVGNIVTNAGRGLEMLGGGASSVVPALSVINIKDLLKEVKPLLRDPKQTSRTGGNSKRYVYAYRGVCRQARKGHDRWQSQISFGGTNHYRLTTINNNGGRTGI